MAALTKRVPFARELIERITARHPTPVYLYDEAGIRAGMRRLNRAFSWSPGFREYFAVKATPNPFLLKILRAEGAGADCSSMAELVLAAQAGFRGEDIMFSSNDTPASEYVEARRLGAWINLDDVGHLDYLEREAGLAPMISFRYNPGRLAAGNGIIGDPLKSKFGATRAQLFEGYRAALRKGVQRFGLHAMVVSNELRTRAFVETAAMMFDLALEIARRAGIVFEVINLGGGYGLPYRPGQKPVDVERVAAGVRRAYQRLLDAGHPPVKLAVECGRWVTGPHGYLVARVRHLKKTYRSYAGLDATMADLMRPGMYGAYHHISIPGKERRRSTIRYDITGSLCENNDKFAVGRLLPEIEVGDLMILHDAGAHGHSMGFNYNGKLRPAEVLVRPDGSFFQIRRAESLDDYLSTLDLAGLARFSA